MTDNEIIEALHCCNNGLCDRCAYSERCPFYGSEEVAECRRQMGADLLDLIKRQQAEIEDLNATIHSIITAQADLTNNVICDSLEAFTERLKEAGIYIRREIDKVVKEIAGETE